VTDPIAAAGVIAELFTWIGLLLGGGALVAGFIRGAMMRQPRTHRGAVVEVEEHSVTFRWFGEDGGLHEATAPPLRRRSMSVGDEVTVYTPRSSPEHGRIDPVDHLGRTLRVIGWVLFGIGLLAAALSVVLLFL
jgi:hypothetical protein